MRRLLTGELEQQIAKRYSQGESSESLQAEFNLYRGAIPRICHRAGIVLRDRSQRTKKTTPEQRDSWVTAYLSGESASSIASRTGIGRETIRESLLHRGVKLRKRYVFHRRSLKPDVFEKVTPESAYWIGYMMADGCVWSGATKGITLSAAKTDEQQIRKFRKFIGSTHKLAIQPNHWNDVRVQDSVRLMVPSAAIARSLSRYGVVPRKSKTATASPLVAQSRDFWRGVVDGDGAIFFSGGYPYFRLCGSESLLKQFAEFIHDRLSITLSVRPAKAIYEVGCAGSKAAAVCHLLYSEATTYLPRKLRKAMKMVHTFSASLMGKPAALRRR